MMRSKIPVLASILALACVTAVPAQGTDGEPEPAVIEPSPSGLMEAEWRFLKVYGQDKDDDVAEAVLPDLEHWLLVYPDSEYAPEARLLKARLHLRLGDGKRAITELLKHLQEYPGSSSGAAARELFTATVSRELNSEGERNLSEIGKVQDPSEDKAVRLARALGALAAREGDEFYEPLLGEFAAFFDRFPSYPGRDVMQLQLGDLHAGERKHLAARLAYEKLIKVYPDSALLAKAKCALGGVLADEFKEYDAAIALYQGVADSYPGTEEAWTAYKRLAELSEGRKKYPLAVEVHEKIIELYPERPEAYDSYIAEARILREEMSKYQESVSALCRLADAYKGERGVKALYLAAEIAAKDMKDLQAEVKMYDRIAAEYPRDPEAPKALYAAADAYEDAGKFGKAREYYTRVSDEYPDDNMSKKARKRVDAIISK